MQTNERPLEKSLSRSNVPSNVPGGDMPITLKVLYLVSGILGLISVAHKNNDLL